MSLPDALGVSRVLVVGTGAIGVAHLPALVHVLRFQYRAEPVVAVTAAARRLVSVEALAALSGQPVVQPEWPANPAGAEHVRWAQWADLVLVWPATLHFMARCAHGLASDVPSSTVLATQAPVIFAPSLANVASNQRILARVLAALKEDGHTVLDWVAAVSVTSGETAPGGPVPLETLLGAIPQVVKAARSRRPGHAPNGKGGARGHAAPNFDNQ